jgi:DMSO/TMAO reductase YedYZ molybdopterin-dependent catalytic subunit
MSRLRTASFTLSGEVARPVRLTVGDLRERWRPRRADVVFHCLKAGPQGHTFAGPLLRDVVADAGPAFGTAGRKARARFVLAVSGGDGHHAVLSWAEIDADFGDVPMLLATDMDGRGLETEGAQLVVPSDYCGARYISAVTAVRVTEWPAAGALLPSPGSSVGLPGPPSPVDVPLSPAADPPSVPSPPPGAMPAAAGSGDGQ